MSVEPRPLALSHLPFAAAVDAPTGDLTGSLTIRFRPQKPELERLPSCEGATRMFASAADHQLFTSSANPTKMSLASRRHDEPTGAIELVYQVESLPRASLDNYFALLAHLNLESEPIDRVSIAFIGSATRDRDDAATDPNPQPPFTGSDPTKRGAAPECPIGRPKEPGFRVLEPEAYAFKEAMDTWLEFEHAIRPSDVKAIDEAMCTWGYFVAMGGFDLSLGYQDFIPEFGTVSHVEPNVVRYSKEYFNAPSTAIDALALAVLTWRGTVSTVGPGEPTNGKLIVVSQEAGRDLRADEVERIVRATEQVSSLGVSKPSSKPYSADATRTVLPTKEPVREALPFQQGPPSSARKSAPLAPSPAMLAMFGTIGPSLEPPRASLPFAPSTDSSRAASAAGASMPVSSFSRGATLDTNRLEALRVAALPFAANEATSEETPSTAKSPPLLEPPLEAPPPASIEDEKHTIEEGNAPTLPPPPRIGPLAGIQLEAPLEASAPAALAEAEAEVEAWPKDCPIELCAAIAAEIDGKRGTLADILERHKLTEAAWTPIEKRWIEAINEGTERDDTSLMEAYDTAYVEQLEKDRGPIQAAAYARLFAGRGSAAIDGLALPREGAMRIKRVGLRRMANDPAFAAELASAIAIKRT